MDWHIEQLCLKITCPLCNILVEFAKGEILSGSVQWANPLGINTPVKGLTAQTYSNAGFRLACRYAAWSSLSVSKLQLSAATPLWLYHRAASFPSWIEFNCLWSAAVGKAARLSIYWLDAACRLVILLWQVALAQLNKYHHQCGKRQVSLKPA